MRVTAGMAIVLMLVTQSSPDIHAVTPGDQYVDEESGLGSSSEALETDPTPDLPAVTPDDRYVDEESGVRSSPEALQTDLGLVAEARGWTIEQATQRYETQQAVGALIGAIAKERPDAYVGAALGEAPGDPATVYIKGAADRRILELIEASGVPIVLADNQPYSFDELEARKLRVTRALEALGFEYVATAVNITGAGVIPATVAAAPGLPSSAAEVLELLPADLRDSVELTVRDDWPQGG
jgi:hypothetical protein